ncbi:hypothetical protein [Oceanisphaera arctica]|uniref:hypothetical protein n=1 Tax=Oceanisphaera arctica TaxID=641510 RepID=UPI001E4AD323|nr:hypothetical protein [Oceanisphaera arctica]
MLADIESLAPVVDDPGLRMRQAIAEVVTRSKREIPHYYLERDIPLARAQDWCSAFNQGKPAEQLVLVSPGQGAGRIPPVQRLLPGGQLSE